MLKPRLHRARCAIGVVVVLALPAICAAEPCTDPADPCVEGLLDQFEPYLFLEDNGPGGSRREFPVAFSGADDDTVENNKEQLASDTRYTVYRHAERLTTAEAPCWLLEYHYYLAANWQDDVWQANGYTHEHDWEWVYVLAGWSSRLQRYVGYAATLSCHDADNLDAMANHHTYLFPLVVLEPEQEDDLIRSERRLAGWTDDTNDLLTRAAVVMTGDGNALAPYKPGTGGLIDAGLPAWREPAPSFWQLGQQGSGCMRATTSENCYGDPAVCTLPFLCSGRDECGDCGSGHYVPWRRAGLWDASSVPDYFAFPADLRTEVDPQPGTSSPLDLTTGPDWWRLRWEWRDASAPDSFEIIATTPELGWRCQVGTVPAHSALSVYETTVLARSRQSSGQGSLVSQCLLSNECAGGHLEVWAVWSAGGQQLAASTLIEQPSGVDLRLRLPPNPFVGGEGLLIYLLHPTDVRAELVDVTGRQVLSQTSDCCRAGWQRLQLLDGGRLDALPGGIYWIRVRAGSRWISKRICIVH